MYLMLTVFLMELAFSILPKFLGEITNLIGKVALRISTMEARHREEIRLLKEDQSQLSMTDNFVQYARLQRKVDKMMAEIKQMGGMRQQKATYLRMGITIGMYVIHAVMMLTLLFYYRSEPLMYLPEEWVSPLTKIVAFPSGVPGALGFGCWVMISNTVIRRGRSVLGV